MKKYKKRFNERNSEFKGMKATPQALSDAFQIEISDAKRVLALMRKPLDGNRAEKVMQEINNLTGGFGVEAVRMEGEHIDNYYYDIIADYVNTGDTYSATILHDSDTGEFHFTTWGDFYEWYEAFKKNSYDY